MDMQEWIEEAADALSEGDYKRAQRAAEKVIEARHASGFELLARAWQGMDNVPRAITVLQDGVSKAPRAWPLWMMLGELRSENGEYDLALLAYDTALGLEGVDADDVHVNAAIVHERAGRPEDALMRLHEVRGANAETAVAAARVRAHILLDMERPDAAAAAAKSGLARVGEEMDGSEVAPLHAALAKAAWMKGDRESALHHAWEAIEHDPDDIALSLIREIEGDYSETAKQYRILVHGVLPAGAWDDDEPRGFWRKYDVVADDEDDAMGLIRRIEPETVRNSLRADEVEVLDDASDQARGVAWCSPRAFYTETDE